MAEYLMRPGRAWLRRTSGAVHSGVPAWLLVESQVLRRCLDSPKSHTCASDTDCPQRQQEPVCAGPQTHCTIEHQVHSRHRVTGALPLLQPHTQ